MPLIGPSFFILGLIMALAIADETATDMGLFTNTQGFNKPLNDSNKFNLTTEMPFTNNKPLNDSDKFNLPTEMPFTNNKSLNDSDKFNLTTEMPFTNNKPLNDSDKFNLPTEMPFTDTTMNITSTTSAMNITNPNSTTTLATTKQKGGKTTEGGKTFITSKTTSKTTSAPNKRKNNDSSPGGYDTGMYVIISIIIVAVGLGVVCYVVRNRGRRQSVDFMSRHDEANVPLSIMDHEPVDTISQNGLQTFETTETTAKEPQEPETKPEGQLDQKRDSKSVAAEADKSVVDPSAESAAPSPHDSEDKPKEDVAKPSPTPAPVQPSLEEKTDDEGVDSNKTSVESLKETNENNSNNAVFRQKTDLDSSIFWAVPLDSPV